MRVMEVYWGFLSYELYHGDRYCCVFYGRLQFQLLRLLVQCMTVTVLANSLHPSDDPYDHYGD